MVIVKVLGHQNKTTYRFFPSESRSFEALDCTTGHTSDLYKYIYASWFHCQLSGSDTHLETLGGPFQHLNFGCMQQLDLLTWLEWAFRLCNLAFN